MLSPPLSTVHPISPASSCEPCCTARSPPFLREETKSYRCHVTCHHRTTGRWQSQLKACVVWRRETSPADDRSVSRSELVSSPEHVASWWLKQ